MEDIKRVLKCAAVLSISSMVHTSAIGTVEGQPDAFVTIDGQKIPLEVQAVEGGWLIPPDTAARGEGGSVIFTEGVKFNVDPSIAYGFSVVDLGAPSAFGFSFASPIVPTGPGTAVASTIAAGLLDFTDNGIAMAPTPGSDIQKNSARALQV